MGEKGNIPTGASSGSGSKNPLGPSGMKQPGGSPGQHAGTSTDDAWSKAQTGRPGDPMGKLASGTAAEGPPPAAWSPQPHAAPPMGAPPLSPYVGGVVHRHDDRDDDRGGDHSGRPPANGPGS